MEEEGENSYTEEEWRVIEKMLTNEQLLAWNARQDEKQCDQRATCTDGQRRVLNLKQTKQKHAQMATFTEEQQGVLNLKQAKIRRAQRTLFAAKQQKVSNLKSTQKPALLGEQQVAYNMERNVKSAACLDEQRQLLQLRRNERRRVQRAAFTDEQRRAYNLKKKEQRHALKQKPKYMLCLEKKGISEGHKTQVLLTERINEKEHEMESEHGKIFVQEEKDQPSATYSMADKEANVTENRKNSMNQINNLNTVITIDDDDDDDDDENMLPVSNTSVTMTVPVTNSLVVASTSKTVVNTTEVSQRATPESIQSSLMELIKNLRNMPQSNIITEIHKIFSLCYKYNNEESSLMDFKMSVTRRLFSKVFFRWEGWNPYDSKHKLSLQAKTVDLYNTLMANLSYICEHIDRNIKQVIYEDINDSVLTMYCSLKALKTFFNNEPTKCKAYYNLTIPPVNNTSESLEPETIVNWPFVKIKISLPGFEMIHENKNTCNFKIVNLKRFKGLKKSPKRNTDLRIRLSSKAGGSVLVHKLMAYLHRLKKCVAKDVKLQSKRKYNLYTVLTELENDVSSCVNDIITGCEYNLNLSPYSYLRYLGRPYRKDTPHKTVADQLVLMDETGLNIRLLQIVFPVVSFTLNNFTLSDLAPELFDLYYESIKNDCLTYQCTFCSVNFDSYMAQYEMIHHLFECHGTEPDWICSNCSTSFSTKDLSSCRWHHSCV